MSKLDSLADLPHDVKVKVDIVVGREDGGGDFSRGEQMPKIRACIALTNRTTAVGIERALVSNVARIFYKHAAFAGVESFPVPENV